ncbi:MAG: chloride channel protein [Gammaproteobacteria bacterium]|nr:chloride channel protein [Gammaproteobacteria bacterium]
MATEPNTITRILRITAFGILTGAAASLAAIVFVEIVAQLNNLLFISPRSRVLAGETPWLTLMTIVVPTAGGLVVGLLCRYIAEDRPHTPSDVIRSVQLLSGKLPMRSSALTALASIVALGSGASVGQYGPLAHMGATLGSATSRLFKAGRTMGTIGVGCGVAAAISTAFNAPIAGIIFAHEVILRHYSLRAFAPITVASTMGFIVANVLFERAPLFRIQSVSVDHALEFLAFVIIGITGALVAVAFMRSILFCNRLADNIPLPSYLKPMVAGAVVGVVAIWLPDILGIGKETLRFAIIEDAFSPAELTVTLIAKILATALCIGFGFAGGVFMPAMLIGILFGALGGAGMEWVVADFRSDIAIYAICGMVAVTSPVIGAPLTSILIVFELTRNYDLTTAAMVSVVFSNVVAYRIFGRSLFDVQLSLRGFDLSLGRDKVVLDHRVVADYLTQKFTRLAPTLTLSEAKAVLTQAGNSEGYVVSTDGIYLGTVSLPQLLALEAQGQSVDERVDSVAAPEQLVLTSDTSLWEAMENMGDFVGESIPVLRSTNDRHLAGVVFEASIVKGYMDVQHEIRRDEHGAG